jgi:hypothetical protein
MGNRTRFKAGVIAVGRGSPSPQVGLWPDKLDDEA